MFERYMKPHETGEQARKRLLQQAASNQDHAGMNLEGALGLNARSFRRRHKQADLDKATTNVIETLSRTIKLITTSTVLLPTTGKAKRVLCPSFDAEKSFRIEKIAPPGYAWSASLPEADGLWPHRVTAHPQNGCQARDCSKAPGTSTLQICGHKLCGNCTGPGVHCPLCAIMAKKVMNGVMNQRVRKYDDDFLTLDRIHEQALKAEGESLEEEGEEEDEDEGGPPDEGEDEDHPILVLDDEEEPVGGQAHLSEDLRKRREKVLSGLRKILSET
jgi:hypothetical protein